MEMSVTNSLKESTQSMSCHRPNVLRELQSASFVVAKQRCHPIFMQVIELYEEDDSPETDGLASFNRQEHAEEVSSLQFFHQKREEIEKTSGVSED